MSNDRPPERTDYDVAHTGKIKFDILVNNTGIGEGVPISEIPVESMGKNFETNVFAALDIPQRVVRSWVATGSWCSSSAGRSFARRLEPGVHSLLRRRPDPGTDLADL